MITLNIYIGKFCSSLIVNAETCFVVFALFVQKTYESAMLAVGSVIELMNQVINEQVLNNFLVKHKFLMFEIRMSVIKVHVLICAIRPKLNNHRIVTMKRKMTPRIERNVFFYNNCQISVTE